MNGQNPGLLDTSFVLEGLFITFFLCISVPFKKNKQTHNVLDCKLTSYDHESSFRISKSEICNKIYLFPLVFLNCFKLMQKSREHFIPNAEQARSVTIIYSMYCGDSAGSSMI